MRPARPPIGVAARALGALVACGTALALPSAAQAQPGDLDRTFSGDGRVTTRFPGSEEDAATAVAVQQDGRIVAAGDSSYGAVARYLRGGSLDPSFGGGDGFVRPPQLGRISDVAIDSLDRILVAGASYLNGHDEMRVARFLASGELDHSFGVDGIRRVRFGGDAGAGDLELEQDGGMIVAGASARTPAANSDFTVVKLTPNGALDQSFANGGVKLIHIRGNDHFGSGMDIDRRGRITLGGTSNDHASFARLMPSGRLDRSFSGNGRRILTKLRNVDEVSEIAVKRGGGILAAGTTYRFSNDGSPTQLDMYLASLRPDGSLNRSFGHRGRRAIDLSRLDRANDLAFQAGGKIVVAGTSDFRFAVLRLTRDGRLDSTFSGNGKTLTRFNRRECVALGLMLQPDGKIVVAGYAFISYDENLYKFALARYKNDGLPAGR